jgi:hypothetical protein
MAVELKSSTMSEAVMNPYCDPTRRYVEVHSKESDELTVLLEKLLLVARRDVHALTRAVKERPR